MSEFVFDVSCCGYCGDVIDYCQGHGEDERAAYGFDYDSDEYEFTGKKSVNLFMCIQKKK